mgnify:CR=1
GREIFFGSGEPAFGGDQVRASLEEFGRQSGRYGKRERGE